MSAVCEQARNSRPGAGASRPAAPQSSAGRAMRSENPRIATRSIALILLLIALLRPVSIRASPLHPDDWHVDLNVDLLNLSLLVLAVLVLGLGGRLGSRQATDSPAAASEPSSKSRPR